MPRTATDPPPSTPSSTRPTAARPASRRSSRARSASSTAPACVDAMQRLARISDLAGRALNYAHLRFAADTEDPANGALLQRSTERATQIQTRLIFFELEWVAIDDERAEELLATDGLDFCRHHLRMERRYRPHLLTAPEERIVTELSPTGHGAWSRLFDELTSAIRVELPDGDEPVALDIALSGLFDPDRDRSAAPSPRRSPRRSSPACGPAPTPSTRCFRRRRPWIGCAPTRTGWRPATSPTRPPTSRCRRWSRPSAAATTWRGAGTGRRRSCSASTGSPTTTGWPSSAPTRSRSAGRRVAEIVLDTFDSVSPRMSEIAGRFIGERWIDVPPRPGKRGGAFSASTVPSVHPYVMLNWTDRRRDVTTLAHELGHGIHQFLAAEQGIYPPEHAADRCRDRLGVRRGAGLRPPARAGHGPALAAQPPGRIDRGTDRHRLPADRDEPVRGPRPHRPARARASCRSSASASSGPRRQTEMLGDAVEVTEGYRSWWSYVPHFIGSPGYVYAYAYGQLLALSVYRLYVERGEEIVPDYLEMLACGGSRSPGGARPDRRRRPRRSGLLGSRARPRRRAARRAPRRPPSRSSPPAERNRNRGRRDPG